MNIDNKPPVKNNTDFDAKKLVQKITEAIDSVADASMKQTERTAEESIKTVKNVSAKTMAMKHMGDSITSSPYIKISPESIDKMSKTMFPPALIHPLEMVATELTQNKVVAGIDNLTHSVMNMNKGDDGVYSLASPEIVNSLQDLRHDTDEKLGEVVKRLDKVEGNTNPLLKVYDLFIEYGKDIWGLLLNSKKFTKLTDQILKAAKVNQNIQLAWMERDTVSHARGTSEKLNAQMFGAEGPQKWYQKLARMIVPEDSTTDKAIKNINGVAAFFGAVGGIAGSGMMSLVEHAMSFVVGGTTSLIGKGIGLLAEMLGGLGGFLGTILGPIGTVMTYLVGGPTGLLFRGVSALVGFIGGSAVIMGGLVALIAGSAIYDIITNPGRILEYGHAFANLWEKGIVPVMDALSKALEPIATALINWWNGPGESGFAKLGYYVNEAIIFVLGTTLPGLLKGFADLITLVADDIGTIYNTVAGIFGYGPNASLGFFGNLENMFNELGGNMLKMLDVSITAIISALGLSSLFGMDDNTSFYHAMVNALENIGTALLGQLTAWAERINAAFDAWTSSLINYVTTTIDNSIVGMKALFDRFNPMPKIEQWIQSAVDFILGLFPSIDDMKNFMIKMLKKLPGSAAAEWLYSQIAGDAPATEDTSESQYNRFAQTPAVAGATNVVIQQNAGHVVTTNNVSGGGGRRGSEGVPNTRPNISEWDRRINTFGNQ